MDSSLRSPPPDADDDRTPPSPQRNNPTPPRSPPCHDATACRREDDTAPPFPVSHLAGDQPAASLVQSPARSSETPTPTRSPSLSHLAASSPVPSPARDAENPISHRSSSASQLSRDGPVGSPAARPPPVESPNQLALFPLPLPAHPKDLPEKPASPAAPPLVANRLLHEELAVLTKAENGGGGGGGRSQRYSSGQLNGSRVVSGTVRQRTARRAVLGLRFLAVVLSLISFSVMAADKTTGWAGDSFDRYREYRYLLSMNVITFVYSGFQVYSYFHHMIMKKHIIHLPVSYYFNFLMDQVLAYLLMSASSSAASRTDGWVSMFGSDDFTVMANASISMSFLAFVVVALNSLVSAYDLFRRTL